MQIPRIFRRSRAYKRCFLGDKGEPHLEAEQVLADLKRFCRADRPTIVVSPVSRAVDPLASAVAEGRREVWLRIAAMLALSEAQVARLQEDLDE